MAVWPRPEVPTCQSTHSQSHHRVGLGLPGPGFRAASGPPPCTARLLRAPPFGLSTARVPLPSSRDLLHTPSQGSSEGPRPLLLRPQDGCRTWVPASWTDLRKSAESTGWVRRTSSASATKASLPPPAPAALGQECSGESRGLGAGGGGPREAPSETPPPPALSPQMPVSNTGGRDAHPGLTVRELGLRAGVGAEAALGAVEEAGGRRGPASPNPPLTLSAGFPRRVAGSLLGRSPPCVSVPRPP